MALATSTLTVTASGLGRYGEAGSVLEVRPEVNLQSIKGVFAEIKGLTTTLLTKDADIAVNRGDDEDTTAMLQAVHRRLGKVGSTLVTKSRNKRDVRRKRAAAASTAASTNHGRTSAPPTPLKTVQPPTLSDVATAVKNASKKFRSDQRKAGFVVCTVEEQDELIEAEEMEDAGGTLEQAVERAGTDGVANAARLAELTGEEPALQKRRRVPPRRPGGD